MQAWYFQINQQLSPTVSLSAISILNIFLILYLQEMMSTNSSTYIFSKQHL